MKRVLAIVAVLGVGLVGCQAMNVQGDQAADEPIYYTGSHLPSRTGGANTAQSVKTLAPPPFDQQMKGGVCVGGPCGSAN
jgi:hypothetical protein